MEKKINLKEIYDTILLFFLVFGFPIISIINSVKVVMLLLILFIILGKKFPFSSKYLFSFEFTSFMFLYSLFAVFTAYITIKTKALDFSLFTMIISSIVMILISLFFIETLEIDICEGLWKCFVAQAVIILLCIVSQRFYDLTSHFRAQLSDRHLLAYGRLRGNAVSGYQFFGISTMFGFVIIWAILNFKKTFTFSLQFIIVVTAGIISGRYCTFSLIIGFIIKFLIFLKKAKIKTVISIILILTGVLFIAISTIFTISEKISNPLIKKQFDNYLIEPINSILIEHHFHSNSTDILTDMYDIDLEPFILHGAGQYTTKDGHYFGGVDVGYLRVILYYGIYGMILLPILFLLFMLIPGVNKNIDLKLAFFIYYFVLNAKGDIQIYANMLIPILIGFCFFSQEKKQNIEINHNTKSKKLIKYIFKYN